MNESGWRQNKVEENKPNVVSLSEIRNRHLKREVFQARSLDEQIQILMADVDFLIGIVMEQEERLDTLEDRCWKAIRMMRKMQEAATRTLSAVPE